MGMNPFYILIAIVGLWLCKLHIYTAEGHIFGTSVVQSVWYVAVVGVLLSMRVGQL
jgi:hypothetical protein